ncbi:MAG: response regulator [Acidobacteria bacterium]|nr:response regulator [Acidobacteriota bacterium]MBV9478777.1 response regulator [Acidobacteriota bacterium]
MTEATRRRILRYGIALDLVIVATGAGLLVPASAPLLLVVFVAAIALSAWKGGWQGGLTALLASIAAWVFVFPDVRSAVYLAMLTVAGALAGGIVTLLTAPRAAMSSRAPMRPQLDARQGPLGVLPLAEEKESTRDASTAAELERLRREADAARREAEQRAAQAEQTARVERERLERELAERTAQERALRERLAAEERERTAREVAAREERERAERELAERERELAARMEREVAERVAREAEERERVAREAAAREERERVERELAERERELAARMEREVAERVAREAEERERVARETAAREERERAERELAERERELAARMEREVAERVAREAEERERVARETAAREERERAQRELAERERELAERFEREFAQRTGEHAGVAELERIERERLEAERAAQDAEQAALEARLAAEEAQRVALVERERLERELAERVARERELEERLAAEHLTVEAQRAEREAAGRELEARLASELEARLEAERLALRAKLEEEVAAEREAIAREAEARVEQMRREVEEEARRNRDEQTPGAAASAMQMPAAPRPASDSRTAQRTSWIGAIADLFRGEERSGVNLNNRKISGNQPPRRTNLSSPAPSARRKAHNARKPRLLMLERRRATADTAVPKLRLRGVEVEVVERWVDAVDELFRFRPDAICLDAEHPEFETIYRTIAEKAPNLPILVTGRSSGLLPQSVRYAAFIVRPYDVDELMRLAQQAREKPEELVATQMLPRVTKAPAAPPQRMPQAPHAPAAPMGIVRPAPVGEHEPEEVEPISAASAANASNDEYDVACFSCRALFNAIDADWCSCLTKERTLVCTNCLACFCKAPPSYKEKFWVQAPPRLFERKSAEVRRQGHLPDNAQPEDVTRPLVLCVEDDEEIQAIVQRVCSNLGYGFIYATNGQDGLNIARLYRPNLILSDAFMPKLDGREMCRMLKEEPLGAECKMVVMTGLYTDTKYRSEAVKRFHVDDYIAKPVAITDLINLLQRHLEGVAGLPVQEDLHELHRQDVSNDERHDESHADDVPLADVLAEPSQPRLVVRAHDGYEVTCVTCQQSFDATRAEWCSCVGRDNTLLCTHCGNCFCKAPASYKERFWMDAPPSLFERKMIGSKRSLGARINPSPDEVKRPLILLVEDDENVQLIVRTVVTTMGYGFVVGANGQEGLSLAREYGPDLILSDAFMPKLDGREMCRLLKEDPSTSRSKAIIMTGLYTDRKYRNEALDYFKVDDYVAKPLAVDDLIRLFKKHLPQEVQAAM